MCIYSAGDLLQELEVQRQRRGRWRQQRSAHGEDHSAGRAHAVPPRPHLPRPPEQPGSLNMVLHSSKRFWVPFLSLRSFCVDFHTFSLGTPQVLPQVSPGSAQVLPRFFDFLLQSKDIHAFVYLCFGPVITLGLVHRYFR